MPHFLLNQTYMKFWHLGLITQKMTQFTTQAVAWVWIFGESESANSLSDAANSCPLLISLESFLSSDSASTAISKMLGWIESWEWALGALSLQSKFWSHQRRSTGWHRRTVITSRWLKFGLFSNPAWAVGSYRSGWPASRKLEFSQQETFSILLCHPIQDNQEG